MEVRNFYFRDRFGKWRLLGKYVSEAETWVLLRNFLKVYPHFKSYYTRCWNDKDGNTWYDVGSHTEFFIWGFEKEETK